MKKIKKKCRGGHLLSVPDEAIAILEAVKAAVPAEFPLTTKLRRAYDDTPADEAENFDRVFGAALDLQLRRGDGALPDGAAEIRRPGEVERRCGRSRSGTGWGDFGIRKWEVRSPEVTDSKRSADRLASGTPAFRLPASGFVLGGSGDIWTAADIFRMLRETGVDWVSVARGCIGNPWIFAQARALMLGQAALPPSVHQQRDVLLEHFELSVRFHGEASASRMMRKFGIKFSRHHPEAAAIKSAFIKVKSIHDWRAVLSDHYSHNGPGVSGDVALPEEAKAYADCGI